MCMCTHMLLRVQACVYEFVCVYDCIHFISAGFPVQSPPSDTADDGCAAVICFICLGVSLASSTTEQPSMKLSGKKGGNHPCAPV